MGKTRKNKKTIHTKTLKKLRKNVLPKLNKHNSFSYIF